jgi:carbonic anhydrase
MSVTDDLLSNNAAFAESFRGGGLPSPPRLKVAVLACMDARMDLHAILGLREGDAHVIRNAGGVVTDDAIRSLTISQRLLGTEEALVVQHTGCGMLSFTDEELAERLEREAGERPGWSAQAFSDLEQSVRDSVARLKASPFLAHQRVRGFVYDVESGRLREVSAG